jgi:hypothetical protein
LRTDLPDEIPESCDDKKRKKKPSCWIVFKRLKLKCSHPGECDGAGPTANTRSDRFYVLEKQKVIISSHRRVVSKEPMMMIARKKRKKNKDANEAVISQFSINRQSVGVQTNETCGGGEMEKKNYYDLFSQLFIISPLSLLCYSFLFPFRA